MNEHEYLFIDERAREVFDQQTLDTMLTYATNYFNTLNDVSQRVYKEHAKWLPDKFAWNRTAEGASYWKSLVENCIKTPRGTKSEKTVSETIIDGQLYVV